ncbi:MAG: DUF1775 domain-containing protein [Aquihabitans sp.]
MSKRAVLIAAVLLAVGFAAPASAHTESDVVAVPAGQEATVSLKPTHGCGESPTIAVAVQAPVEGAKAKDVAGWTATATEDGEGNTVLEWTGGVLPVDQTGSFPVIFTAPDQPGLLMLFPSVQTCEDGSELSWISGDPADEFPAPRVLVLPADQEAAGSIDEVAPDAPGRDQLTEIVDVDNPDTDTDTVVEEGPVTTETSEATTTTAPSADDDGTPLTRSDDDDSSNTGRNIAIAVVLVALIGGGAAYVIRKQREED